MRGATLGVAAAILVSMLFASPRSRAETGAALVAIVTAEPGAPLTRRVRAQLEGLGVEVIVLKPPAEASPLRAPLEQAARSVGAIAAVRLVVSGEGKVEVWVADRVTGKAVVRELDRPASGASDAAVAVGAVELLRASLMELHSAEPPHGDVPANEKVQSLGLPVPIAPWVPRLGLAVGAGVELGVRGLGSSSDIEVGLWAHVMSRFGARVAFHASLTPSRVATPSGSVDARSQLFGAMGTYDFVDRSSPWVPTASLGIAAARVSATGTAVLPFVSATEEAWLAAPIVGAGLAWSFARGLSLRGDGLAAWAFPAARVRTPTTTAGVWGAPALMLSLGVEVLWGS